MAATQVLMIGLPSEALPTMLFHLSYQSVAACFFLLSRHIHNAMPAAYARLAAHACCADHATLAADASTDKNYDYMPCSTCIRYIRASTNSHQMSDVAVLVPGTRKSTA